MLSLVTNRLHNVITPSKLKLGSNDIGCDKYSKCLGVKINRNLKFSKHISTIHSKMSRIVGIFNKSKNVLNKSQMIKLYYSLIYPYLTYCNEIWGGTSETHIKPLLLLKKENCTNYTKFKLFVSYRPSFLPNMYFKGT